MVNGAAFAFSSNLGNRAGFYSRQDLGQTFAANSPTVVSNSVTFVEAGLPIGIFWNVTLDSQTLSSNSSSITFASLSSGNHSWSSSSFINGGAGTKFSIAGATSGSVSVPNQTSVSLTYATQYYLNVRSGSGGSTSASSGWYNSGTIVSILASPIAGHNFTAWVGSGNGSYSGTSNPVSITVNSPITETAEFELTLYAVTFSETGLPAGTSWTVTLDESNESSSNNTINFYNVVAGELDWSASYPSGAISGLRYAPRVASGTLNVHAQTSATISYSAQYYLDLKVWPLNAGNISQHSGWFSPNLIVSVSINPAQGYVFSNWTGSGDGSYSGTNKQISLTIYGPIVETANLIPAFGIIFTETGLPLGVSWTITLRGEVQTATTNSIAFVVFGPGEYNWSVQSPVAGAFGTQYVPAAAFGSFQVQTSGESSVNDVSVRFITQYYVNILTSNSGGTATPKSGWFSAESTVKIFAAPSPGFNFSGWQVSDSSSSLPTTVSNSSTEIVVTVNGPGTVTALFTQFPGRGEATSSGGFLDSVFSQLPGLADPEVQFALLAVTVGIIMISAFLIVKRVFTQKE